jgi:hypothetical protein
MAKIELTSPIAGIRGTIGGVTYSANRAGPYARAWGLSTNPRTARQVNARNNLSAWSKAWNALTSSNRTGWNTYAAAAAQAKTDSLGNTYYASGFNWYIAINEDRELAGLAATNTAPAAAAPAAPTIEFFIFRSTANGNDTQLRFTAAGPTLTLVKIVEFNIVNSTSVTIGPTKKFFMICIAPDGSRDIKFQDELTEKFGTTFVGQRGFGNVYNLSSEGRRGPAATFVANAI